MRFTIFKRLTIGYAIIMTMVIAMGIYVTVRLNELSRISRSIGLEEVTVRVADHLIATLLSQVSFEKKFVVSGDSDFRQQFEDMESLIRDDLRKIGDLAESPEQKEAVRYMGQRYEEYLQVFAQESDLVNNKTNYPVALYQQQKDRIIDEARNRIKDLVARVHLNREKKTAETARISQRVMRVTAITGGLVAVLGLMISFFNTRTINRSVLLLQKKTRDIAQGKFEEIHEISKPPEIKDLADDFNLMCRRLKELDDLKVDFISHVSHELRTPLTAIREASAMLLEGLFQDDSETRQELLTIVKAECDRLIRSVNRILDLSCMEARMMEYSLREASLIPVLQKSVLKLAPIARKKKIHLEIEPLPDLPIVRADPERMEQMMENLIGNALKYTPELGRVVIHAGVKSGDGRNWVEIAISDTGCGVNQENLEKIFDKFKRIDSGKATTRGTGLGLSICRHIISAHGGRIWAESQPGKGSTFYVSLPVELS